MSNFQVKAEFHSLEYVEFFHSDTDTARRANGGILRDGVVGVNCLYAGDLFSAPLDVELKRTLNSRCCPDEHVGSVEVYENGAVNAFLRRDGLDVAVGVFTVR